MRTYLLVVLFALISTCGYAQTLVQYLDAKFAPVPENEARYIRNVQKTDSGYRVEQFYAGTGSMHMSGLFADEELKVMNGMFRHYFPAKNLMRFGSYKNGLREGLHMSFYYNSMLADSAVYANDLIQGTALSWYPNGMAQDSTFIDNQGLGVRVAWNEDGTLSMAGRLNALQKRTGRWQGYHTNKQLAYDLIFKDDELQTGELYQRNGQKTGIPALAEEIPSYPQGRAAWQKTLLKKLVWPAHLQFAHDGKISVSVAFRVDKQGAVRDVHVVLPFHPEFDKQAVAAIAQSKPWAAATFYGLPIDFWLVQEVIFQQN